MKTIIIQNNAITTIKDKELIDHFLRQISFGEEDYSPVTAISFIDNPIREEISVNLEGKQGLLVGHIPIEPIKYSLLKDFNIEIL